MFYHVFQPLNLTNGYKWIQMDTNGCWSPDMSDLGEASLDATGLGSLLQGGRDSEGTQKGLRRDFGGNFRDF